jgi:uncharacterized protein
MPNGPTISNSSCLIALDAAGQIDILRQLYAALTVPEAVARECARALPPWVQTKRVNDQLFVQSLSVSLGAGEAEAIALAMECAADRLILDDKKARRSAVQLGVPITGTLAILLRAKQHGVIAKVRDVLDALRAVGFRFRRARPTGLEPSGRMIGHRGSPISTPHFFIFCCKSCGFIFSAAAAFSRLPSASFRAARTLSCCFQS